MSIKAEIKREKDVVRRNHLKRQLAGHKGIQHLVPDHDGQIEERDKLNDQVAAIGAKNKQKAKKQNRARGLKKNSKPDSSKG